MRQPPPEVDLLGLLWLSGRDGTGQRRVLQGFDIPEELLENPKVLLWVLHPDGTLETQVGERLDDGPFLVKAPLPSEGIHCETERHVPVFLPPVASPPADLGVEFFIICALGPEFNYVFP